MIPNASFIPPGVTPPDPPEAKVIALIFSMILSGLLIAFIGFMCIDFLAEMTGHPLNFGEQPLLPQEITSFADQDGTYDGKSQTELITPKHQTQMSGPEIVVIYTQRYPKDEEKIPDLLIDGVLHTWETQYGNNTWFARLSLPAGLRRVTVEGSEAEFFVENLDSPLRSTERWEWNRPHPDTNKIDRCHECHEMIEYPTALLGNRSIGSWKGTASCFACHDEEDHAIRHALLQSTTNQCFRCHTMH